MPPFALALHPEAFATDRPRTAIRFVGQSLPHYDVVRAALAAALTDLPALPAAPAVWAPFAAVHTPAYLAAITAASQGLPSAAPLPVNAECAGLEHALPGYRAGLGALCAAIDLMRRGSLERAYVAALGGHHAFPDRGHGYCLLNPLAAAARYAQAQGFRRVLLIDWDHHHGDGTQAIFAHDPTVHCVSVHSALDLYMAKAGSLAAGTTTAGAALGHQNIPVLDQRFTDDTPAQLGLSGAFYRGPQAIDAFADRLDRLPWRPDLIGVFAGYDAHRDDCGRHVTDWDDADFVRLTELTLACARRAGCPILSVHGGGYRLPVTVAAAVRHVRALAVG